MRLLSNQFTSLSLTVWLFVRLWSWWWWLWRNKTKSFLVFFLSTKTHDDGDEQEAIKSNQLGLVQTRVGVEGIKLNNLNTFTSIPALSPRLCQFDTFSTTSLAPSSGLVAHARLPACNPCPGAARKDCKAAQLKLYLCSVDNLLLLRPLVRLDNNELQPAQADSGQLYQPLPLLPVSNWQ